MLKIRLQRTGRRNDPSFRVVVTEHTRGPKSGDAVERVGSYNPKTKALILDKERILHWLSVGAQASDTVYNMLVKQGIVEGRAVNVLPQKSPVVKKEEEEKADTPESKEESAEESAEETTDAPAESVSDDSPNDETDASKDEEKDADESSEKTEEEVKEDTPTQEKPEEAKEEPKEEEKPKEEKKS